MAWLFLPFICMRLAFWFLFFLSFFVVVVFEPLQAIEDIRSKIVEDEMSSLRSGQLSSNKPFWTYGWNLQRGGGNFSL